MTVEKIREEIKEYNISGNKEILKEISKNDHITLSKLKVDELMLFLYEEVNIDSVVLKKVKQLNYNVPDELLVFTANLGEEASKKILLDKYVDVVRQETNNFIFRGYYANGYDNDDLFQEAYIGFMHSIKNYKIHMRNPFRVFVTFVVKRTLELVMSKSRNNKQKALNLSSSYNRTINEDDGETFEEFLFEKEDDPNERLEKKEQLEFFWKELSEFEKSVLIYYSEGYSYQKIGKIILNQIESERVRTKSIDNAIQRINNKRKALLAQ